MPALIASGRAGQASMPACSVEVRCSGSNRLFPSEEAPLFRYSVHEYLRQRKTRSGTLNDAALEARITSA
jgi:hypothetical protein